MKNPAKHLIQLILILSLTLSLVPSTTQFVSARDQAQADRPITFKITGSGQEGIELALSAPSYQITDIQIEEQSFDNLIVPSAVNSAVPGGHQLPVTSRMIAVPPQAEITLEILEDTPQQLPGNFRLPPAPFPARLDETNPTQRWDYARGERIQQSETAGAYAKSLQTPVRIADEAWLRDQRVIRLEYSPFLYNAETGSLVWYPAVSVKVHFDFPFGRADSSLPVLENNNSSSPFEAILETSLLNYEQAKNWRTTNLPTEALVTPPEPGARYRIAIKEDGIYKITYDNLLQAYPDLVSNPIDPRQLQMMNQGEDVAIHVVGESDGSFDPGDYIIFYGQRFYGDRLAELYKNENQHWYEFPRQATDGTYFTWKPEFNEIMLEKYTHENVYWLFEDSTNGLRMAAVNGDPTGNTNAPVAHYRETVRVEESYNWKTWFFSGEETWFWDVITQGGIAEFDANITSPVSSGPDAVIRAEFVSSQEKEDDGFDHHTKIYFNDINYDEFYWSGMSRYVYENEVTAATITEGINTLGIEAFATDQIANPSYYFDWFEIEYNRYFVAQDNAIIFTSPASGEQKYLVENFTDTVGLQVLDITDPLLPVRVLNATAASGQVTISLTHDDLTIAMEAVDAHGKGVSQDQVSYYLPPDWSEMNAGTDYIFFTHADIWDSTQALADYRTNAGFSTIVIDINDLYNEFNFGIFHPIAIKNFLSYAFENWETLPTYALLVGDGHWNLHGYNLDKYGTSTQLMPPNLVWVDPWQGEVDSANLLATIVGEDPFPDLMIARLPVNSDIELNAYISKLKAYEGSSEHGSWEQNHIFIAEKLDPKAGDFAAYADNIIEQFIDPIDYASALTIYQDDYGCSTTGSDQCLEVTDAITNGINTGSLIVSFIGHAKNAYWSKQRIFQLDDFPKLTNMGKLPVFLSMTCLDGFWSGPPIYPGTSMIEELVRKDASGAIAAFSPTGLGVSSGHDVLHEGFYDSLMNDGIWELGSAALNSKLWLYNTGANLDLLHTYTVFGDPALQIRNPFSFVASPSEDEISTRDPGTMITHTITLTNTGSASDSYEIQAKYGWDTAVTPLTAEVAPGETIQIPVEVTTPLQYDVTDTAYITITSRGNSWEPFYSQLTTTIPNVYGFEVSPTESYLLVRPGETIDHTFTLTHTGQEDNSYTIDISGDTWPTTPSLSTIEPLGTGETTQFSVAVESPNQKDVSDSATLTITPVNGLPLIVEIPLTTRVPGDFEFAISPESISGFTLAGSTITYNFTIQNTGLQIDQYQIEVIDSDWLTVLSVAQTENLDFLESAQIQVYVTTPSLANITDTAIIKITSKAVPSETQQISLTTTTVPVRIYLPLINK